MKSDTSTYREENLTKVKCPMCGKLLVKMPGAVLKCQDRSCGHTQPENPDAFSDRRMSRQEYAQQKYLVHKYSDQRDIKTNLGDLLKKALDKKDT